jgi:hypothetical protein
MLDQLVEKIKKDKTNWREFQDLLVEREVASKTILLHEGEIANQVFYIKKSTSYFRTYLHFPGF